MTDQPQRRAAEQDRPARAARPRGPRVGAAADAGSPPTPVRASGHRATAAPCPGTPERRRASSTPAPPGSRRRPRAAGARSRMPARTDRSSPLASAPEVRRISRPSSAGTFLSFLVPLVIYLVFKDRDPFVRHHSATALNFHIILAIAYVVSDVLVLVLIGLFLIRCCGCRARLHDHRGGRRQRRARLPVPAVAHVRALRRQRGRAAGARRCRRAAAPAASARPRRRATAGRALHEPVGDEPGHGRAALAAQLRRVGSPSTRRTPEQHPLVVPLLVGEQLAARCRATARRRAGRHTRWGA